MHFATNRTLDRFPPAAVLAALALAALLVAPAVALGDSTSSGAPPAQYRGPATEASTRWLSFEESRPAGVGDSNRYPERYARWESWFEHEKDGLLRDLLARGAAPAAGDEPAPPAPAPVDLLRPDDRAQRVLPALREALRDENAAIRSAAALALGNAKDPAAAADLARMIRSGGNAERRAAALALGFLGGDDAAVVLEAALAEEPTVDGRSVAAVALGMTKHASAGRILREALARNVEASGRDARNHRAALITALGLAGDREAVPVLQHMLLSVDARDDRARAHAASALGRIGDPAALPPLIKATDDDDAGVRQAAILALGAFRDSSSVQALRKTLGYGSYELERCCAAISLARVAGPAAVGALSDLTTTKTGRSLRGFATLALGLTGARRDAAPVLRGMLALRSEDSLRGAAAIALGLLADRDSLPAISGVYDDASSSAELRGYALLARAMVGDPGAERAIRGVFAGREQPAVGRGAALAAGLRPCPGGSALLARVVLEERDPTVRGAALLGLGLAPDRAPAALFTDFAKGGSATHAERIAAITALGQIALDGALPPVARIASGAECSSFTPMLDRMSRVF